MQWLDFWNRQHRVYVNDRHRLVHYRQVADDIIGVIPRPDALVMDYGCGEALEAARVAGHCRQLWLCDAASSVREQLQARLGTASGIRIVGDEELAAIEPQSLDLIVTNSVLQYLSPERLDELLAIWRGLLKADGRLVLADVLPPTTRLVDDVGALLRTGARHGFLLAACAGLVELLFSDYRKLRRELGLARYAEAELLERLARAGYRAERRAKNFGFNPARMTFLCRPA